VYIKYIINTKRLGLSEYPAFSRLNKYSLRAIYLLCYYFCMTWEVEYAGEFDLWWEALTEDEQESIAASIILLEQKGPMLPFPYSSGISGSTHSHMRELRIQHRGQPYRVLYAFDPRRVALLLIGGNKTGDDRWYDKMIPKADRIYSEHIASLEPQKPTGNKKR